MGLDTVELIMRIEQRLGVRLDDRTWERVRTPQEVMHEIVQHLSLTDGPSHVRNGLVDALRSALAPNVFPEDVPFEQVWSQVDRPFIERALERQGYEPPDTGPKARGYRFLGEEGGSLALPTWGDFIDRVIAHNHVKLLPKGCALAKSDVAAIVLGLTADQCGIPVLRIAMDDSFTTDLGMD
jgi:hypothetical protein